MEGRKEKEEIKKRRIKTRPIAANFKKEIKLKLNCDLIGDPYKFKNRKKLHRILLPFGWLTSRAEGRKNMNAVSHYTRRYVMLYCSRYRIEIYSFFLPYITLQLGIFFVLS